MKYILLLCFISSSAYGFEMPEIFKSAKKKIQEIVGIETEEVVQMELPPIPKVTVDATSTAVYNKSGRIFNQGKSFKDLTLDKKRTYRVAYLRDLYQAVLTQEAGHTELVRFLNVLEQGGSREGVYRSLTLGQEYKALESQSENIKESVVEFCVNYAATYLALSFDRGDVSKLNTWTVKRIVAEKSLEILDAFPTDGKDLYQWYAVLSVDLATQYNSIFKSKSRQSVNYDFYHTWAQSVPIQQVKSEVVIKLHRVFNFLK